MLPEYNAIAFNSIIDKGGRTRPWSVLVDTPEGVQSYVVKMFDTQLVNTRDSVANEVLGNILAKEFDLQVPKAALIHMDEDFRMTIRDPTAAAAYEMADERVKFGSALLEGYQLFSPALSKKQATNMIELDTLFGFDCLIRNRDRNKAKPNLLLKSKSAFLIDHELGFEITGDTIDEFDRKQWDDNFFLHHIFRNYLVNTRNDVKKEYFNTFEEYLRMLNVQILNPYFKQLRKHSFNPARHADIKNWLLYAKQNSGNFVSLLKSFIA